MASRFEEDGERTPIADRLAPKGKPKPKRERTTLRDLGQAFSEQSAQPRPSIFDLFGIPADALAGDSNTTNEGTTMKNDLTVTRDDVVSMKVYGVIALEDPAEDPRQELVDKLWRILGAIDLAENFSLRIGVDEKVPAPYGAVFIQVRCWRRDVITGKWDFGWGGKATVSPFQTDSEIVGMAFGLYKAYFEHEARETFKFEDRRVFGPHIDVQALWSVARKVDVRSAQHTTDKL